MKKLKDEDLLIKDYGFERVLLDDSSGHWLAKAIEHPYLSNLKILIDEIHNDQVIFLEARDFDSRDAVGTFYMGDYSLEELDKILRWLTI